MTRTKRGKFAQISKVYGPKLKGKEKIQAINRVHAMLDEFPRVYVFCVEDISTTGVDKLRQALREDSKFFYGTNRILKEAVGTTSTSEYRTGLSQLAPFLERAGGLFFTRKTNEVS